MNRKLLVIGVLAILMFVLVIPVQAITFGTFDGNDHPEVGSMVAKVGTNITNGALAR